MLAPVPMQASTNNLIKEKLNHEKSNHRQNAGETRRSILVPAHIDNSTINVYNIDVRFYILLAAMFLSFKVGTLKAREPYRKKKQKGWTFSAFSF